MMDICEECGGELPGWMTVPRHAIKAVCINTLKQRIAELEENLQMAEESQRWIPVEERLPEENKEYPVLRKIWASTIDRGDAWVLIKDYAYYNNTFSRDDVVVWFDGLPPLPEPPKDTP